MSRAILSLVSIECLESVGLTLGLLLIKNHYILGISGAQKELMNLILYFDIRQMLTSDTDDPLGR